MIDQKIAGHSADEGVERIYEESSPCPRLKRIHEPYDCADQKNPAERQNRESRCCLVLDDAHRAKRYQHDATYEKPAPGFSDFLDAGCEQTGNVTHCPSPFGYSLRFDFVKSIAFHAHRANART